MKRGSKRQTSMDKFIVRSPKKSPAPSPTKERGGLRQATLESLRGVVVVEDMERAVVVLERSDISPELKVDTLQHLLRKNPAKEVLIKTGLGKTVHKLCRSEDAEVAAVAQRVYRAWKKHILSKMNRPCIEVKCDLKTQRLRSSARQMLCDALQRENGEGGGGGVGGNKERRKQSEAEDQKRSRDCNEVVIKERRAVQKEEEEEKEGKSDGIKSHKGTEDSDRKRDKRKQKEKEKEEEGGAERTPKRQRQEEEEEGEGKNRKRGGEKNQKQKEDEEGSEGGRTQKRKRQEHEIQEEEERKDREKSKEKNPAPTSNSLNQDNGTKHDSVEALAELIEREVYHSSRRRVDNSYRRTIRALVFTLRHQSEVRRTVNWATLSVPDFVKQYRKS